MKGDKFLDERFEGAVRANDPEELRRVIADGYNVAELSQRNQDFGVSYAVMHDLNNVLPVLLENGADTNAVGNGTIPVYMAANHRKLEALRLLVKQDKVFKAGFADFISFCQKGDKAILAILLDSPIVDNVLRVGAEYAPRHTGNAEDEVHKAVCCKLLLAKAYALDMKNEAAIDKFGCVNKFQNSLDVFNAINGNVETEILGILWYYGGEYVGNCSYGAVKKLVRSGSEGDFRLICKDVQEWAKIAQNNGFEHLCTVLTKAEELEVAGKELTGIDAKYRNVCIKNGIFALSGSLEVSPLLFPIACALNPLVRVNKGGFLRFLNENGAAREPASIIFGIVSGVEPQLAMNVYNALFRNGYKSANDCVETNQQPHQKKSKEGDAEKPTVAIEGASGFVKRLEVARDAANKSKKEAADLGKY